jgi:hypothetical protein
MVTEAVQADAEPELAPRLFTTWLTSQPNHRDHAVTDEEFTAHTPEPAAVCGAVVLLAPMEWAPGPRCPGCVAALDAAAKVGTVLTRLQVDNPVSLWVRIFRPFRWITGTQGGASACRDTRNQTFSPAGSPPPGDHPKPPAEMYRPVVSAGATAGTGAQTPFPFRPSSQPPYSPGANPAGLIGGIPPQRPVGAVTTAPIPDGRDDLQGAAGPSAPARRVLQVHQLLANPTASR